MRPTFRTGLLTAAFLFSACAPQPTPTRMVKQLPTRQIDHIVIVVEENHSHTEIIGSTNAPYMNQLAKQGANLKNHHAIEHPSQPNYLDLFSGDNHNVLHDKTPRQRFTDPNLGAELLAKKYTFAGYCEDLPSVGYLGSSRGLHKYARKHAPWVNFTNVPADLNRPLTDFPKDFTRLPTVSFIIPNLDHDMHDGTVKQADDWLKAHVEDYVQWAQTHNSLLIVTWDEDDESEANRIPTFFVGPMVEPGDYQFSTNHFSMLRTLEDLYGLSHAGKSVDAKGIVEIWKPS